MTAGTSFARVLGRKDVLALGFGAMIGWGWVIMSGTWILRAGSVGAMLAFAFTGLAMLIVALLYGELAAAMPKAGGEHVYSLRALGPGGSFVCTWAIISIYVSVCCFEAVALATVFDYVDLNVKQGYLWTVGGYDVYFGWALIGIVAGVAITAINIRGVKLSAVFQTTVTLFILLSGILLVTGATLRGSVENLHPLVASGTAGVLSVVTLAPFFFVGFDVIPQAAEEIDLPFRSIGRLIVVSVCIGILWYCLIILAVAMLSDSTLLSQSRLPTADASAVAWGAAGSGLLVLGGMAGIVTSWNAFLVGGSRAIFAMAENGMLPAVFGRLHPRYRTPHAALILIGVLCWIAPLFGRNVLVWIVNAGSFEAVVAYLLVCVSFIRLRMREPAMPRPFRLPMGLAFGWAGLACCVAIMLVYLPGSPAALAGEEWLVVSAWTAIGIVFYLWAVFARGSRGRLAPGRWD